MIRRFAVLFALVTVAACGGESRSAPPTKRAVRIASATPAPGTVSRRYSGALEPRAQVEVSFKVGGRVERIGRAGDHTLEEGDEIRRGAVLAVLDADDLRDQASSARAAAQSGDAELRAAESALELARVEVERARRLKATGAITTADADRAEASYAAAASRLEAARSARDGRRAQSATARRNLAEVKLTSPIDGVIARRLIDAGEAVAPGHPAFVVIDDRALRLSFAVPDTRRSALALGDTLPVAVEAVPGRVFEGTVTRIDPVADPVLRTFTAQVTIDNADRALHAGMIGTVGVAPELGAEAAAVTVPLGAVQPVPGADELAVWTLDDQGAATRRVVRVHDVIGVDALITEGLADGERVVTDGAAFVREGEIVEVVP